MAFERNQRSRGPSADPASGRALGRSPATWSGKRHAYREPLCLSKLFKLLVVFVLMNLKIECGGSCKSTFFWVPVDFRGQPFSEQHKASDAVVAILLMDFFHRLFSAVSARKR